jgi:ATP adenylyltransferase
MKHLHAPWRLAYVASAPKQKGGCLFCLAPAAGRDAERLLLHRGRTCFTMLNRYPYNGGHLMVAPYAHRGRLQDLTDAERREFLEEARDMEALLDRVLAPHGYNFGINTGRVAGQGMLGHVHLHIVPRWDGDTNFMPTVASTKVISESLDDLYRRLLRLPRGASRRRVPSRKTR